jgi:hypothetical protein
MPHPRACDLPALEHSALIRAGVFKLPCSIILQTEGQEFTASWDGSALHFHQLNQRIRVSGPPTKLGGLDLYLHCPDCGKWRETLYLLDDRFTCHICGNIMATSHALHGIDKIEYVQSRIEQKITSITSPTQWKQSKRKERRLELTAEWDELEFQRHMLALRPVVKKIAKEDGRTLP